MSPCDRMDFFFFIGIFLSPLLVTIKYVTSVHLGHNEIQKYSFGSCKPGIGRANLYPTSQGRVVTVLTCERMSPHHRNKGETTQWREGKE